MATKQERRKAIRRKLYHDPILIWEAIIGLLKPTDTDIERMVKLEMINNREILRRRYDLDSLQTDNEFTTFNNMVNWWSQHKNDPEFYVFKDLVASLFIEIFQRRYVFKIIYIDPDTGEGRSIISAGNAEFTHYGLINLLMYYLLPNINLRYDKEFSTEFVGEHLQGFIPYEVDAWEAFDQENDKGYSDNGHFFKYNVALKLERYGIYGDPKNKPHCLIDAICKFLNWDLDNPKINTIKSLMGRRSYVSTSLLTSISNILGVNIQIVKPKLEYRYKDKLLGPNKLEYKSIEKNNWYPNNKPYNLTMTLFLFLDHYGIHEILPKNSKLFKEVVSIDSTWWSNTLTSTRLLMNLYNKGLLYPRYDLYDCIEMKEYNVPSLNNINNDQRPFNKKFGDKIKYWKRRLIDSDDELSAKYNPQGVYLERLLEKNIHYYSWVADWEAGHLETFENGKLKKQQLPYSVSITGINSPNNCKLPIIKMNPNDIFSEKGMIDFLEYFPLGVNKVWWHNLKYDFRLMMTIGLGTNMNILERKGQIYSVEFVHNNRYFIFVDSWKMIPMALGEFNKVFSLNRNKVGFTLYELYTIDNLKIDNIKIENDPIIQNDKDIIYKINVDNNGNIKGTKRTTIVPEEPLIRLDNIIVPKKYLEIVDKEYVTDTTFKHIEYYDYYLTEDVRVLKEGYNKFEILMRKILGPIYDDIKDNSLTLSALADNYMILKGAYIGVSSVTGELQDFLKQCSPGGKVALAWNKRINTFEEYANQKIKIANFDANALYPTAIYCLKKYFGGIPLGDCVKIPEEIIDKINLEDPIEQLRILEDLGFGSYKIIITKIGTLRSIPIIREIDGKVIWTNDIVGKEHLLDYFMLAAVIEFQGVEFRIIDGEYWPYENGYSSILCDEVKKFYDMRLDILKNIERDPNCGLEPLQLMIKLFLNSVYGKCILSKEDNNFKILEESEAEKYIIENYSKVNTSSSPDIKDIYGNKYYKVNTYNENRHFNRQHIGMMILGCSKYLMARFTCLAEDLGIKLLYTDTDSLHMITCCDEYQNLDEKLRFEFALKYHMDPIGLELEQFKSDFKFDNHSDIYSEGFIGVEKKQYYHKLVGINKDTGQIENKHYFKCKGVPVEAMEYHCKKNNNDMQELYGMMYRNEKIEIDMTAGGAVASFDISSKGIYTRSDVTKKLSGF